MKVKALDSLLINVSVKRLEPTNTIYTDTAI